MEKVHDILSRGKTDCKVFIGTVPAVTIAPLAKGVGTPGRRTIPSRSSKQGHLFRALHLFPLRPRLRTQERELTHLRQAYEIDRPSRGTTNHHEAGHQVQQERSSLQRARRSSTHRRHLRSVAPPCLQAEPRQADIQAAAGTHRPEQAPRTHGGHRLLHRGPHGEDVGRGRIQPGRRTPNRLGHGSHRPRSSSRRSRRRRCRWSRGLDWNGIAASDSLYTNPISLMPELYDNTRLAELLLDLLRLP